ncbi:MAG: hypothetical protein RSC48_05945 [Anaerorhabdus sp.]
MSLENNISTIIQEQMQGDLVERVVKEQLEKCVTNAVNSLFGSWGECTKAVQEKLKEVLMPQIESYNYSEHIIKLDDVLTEVIKTTTVENKKILENFKHFVTQEDAPRRITITDMFEKYKEFVADNVDTYDLDVNTDDRPSYECVECKVEFVEIETRGWSPVSEAKIFFECEHDKSINFELNLRTHCGEWIIDKRESLDLHSLKYLNKFQIYLMQLAQAYTRIEADETMIEDDVEPNAEPEASWS